MELFSCIEKSPFVGKPRVILVQLYLSIWRFQDPKGEVEKGLTLMLEWPLEKENDLARKHGLHSLKVLHMKANESPWPPTAKGILNMGKILLIKIS